MREGISEYRVAIVTGAGSGIGRATALRLLAEGWRVALVGRRASNLQETRQRAGPDSDRALCISANVSSEADCMALIDEVLSNWGRLDLLVNNAAALARRPIADTDFAVLEEVFRINVFGPARLIALAMPLFSRQGSGIVVNVSSLAATDPLPGFFVYGATKAALESLSRSVETEMGGAIHAYTIRLGATDTEMLTHVSELLPSGINLISPDQVADAVMKCVESQPETQVIELINDITTL